MIYLVGWLGFWWKVYGGAFDGNENTSELVMSNWVFLIALDGYEQKPEIGWFRGERLTWKAGLFRYLWAKIIESVEVYFEKGLTAFSKLLFPKEYVTV